MMAHIRLKKLNGAAKHFCFGPIRLPVIKKAPKQSRQAGPSGLAGSTNLGVRHMYMGYNSHQPWEPPRLVTTNLEDPCGQSPFPGPHFENHCHMETSTVCTGVPKRSSFHSQTPPNCCKFCPQTPPPQVPRIV